MTGTRGTVVLVLFGALAIAGCTGPKRFVPLGEPMTIAADREVTVERVLASPDLYEGRHLRIRGPVADICPHRGAWLTLGRGYPPVFVRLDWPGDARLMPADAVGREVIVEGLLGTRRITEAQARVYAEQQGATEAELAAIVGTQEWLLLDCSAVLLEAPAGAHAGTK